MYKVLDRGLIENIGPTGIVNTIRTLSIQSSKIQSGQLNNYSLAMIIGTVMMIMII
ncbi:MAG: hypothetical protein JSU03_13805 [Bacteroidetes bacterium]|nr:hypothetical protein [Bacteroidota bacterium]